MRLCKIKSLSHREGLTRLTDTFWIQDYKNCGCKRKPEGDEDGRNASDGTKRLSFHAQFLSNNRHCNPLIHLGFFRLRNKASFWSSTSRIMPSQAACLWLDSAIGVGTPKWQFRSDGHKGQLSSGDRVPTRALTQNWASRPTNA